MDFFNSSLKLPENLSLSRKNDIKIFLTSMMDDLRVEEKDLLLKLHEHHHNTLIHSVMVAHDVEYIASNMVKPKYSDEEIKALTIAALLHDVGKLRIHDTVLDLGGFNDLKKIWDYIHPNEKLEDQPNLNLIKVITVSDLINYKAHFEAKEPSSQYIFNYMQWMRDKEVIEFLNQPIRTYLEYHQEGTDLELKQIGVSENIIKYAASHHPAYFTENDRGKIPKEAKIIEIADKFNALLQTEGIRYYAKTKSKTQAMIIIIDEIKKEYIKGLPIFNHFEEEILKTLLKKYFSVEDISKDLIPLVNAAIQKGANINNLQEDEKLMAFLVLILTFSNYFDKDIIDELIYLENELMSILEKIRPEEYKEAA